MTGIPLLENSSSMGVLMFVLEHDGCTKQDVYNGYKHNSGIASRISELADAGLIRFEKVGYRGSGTALFLTDSGREVASRLKEIAEILYESDRLRCSAFHTGS